MSERKISINRYFLIYMALIGVISIASLGFLWITSEISQTESESRSSRAAFLEEQKSLLKREVDRAYEFVAYMQSQTEKRLNDSIKNRTNEACALVKNLYEHEREAKSTQEIMTIVREALRPVRFNDGRGYYFILDLNGINQLRGDRPELEGKNLLEVPESPEAKVARDILGIAKKQGEGFYQYNWTKPEVKGVHPKIAFVKLFEPLGWVIGTGEYLDDVEQDIKNECLEWISNIKFGRDGYVFAGQWDGTSLSGPQAGKNMFEVEDVNGVKIVQELIKAAKSGGGYVHYVMPKFESEKQAPKLSYAVGVPRWHWYIGSGKYIDEIEAAIARQQLQLDRRIKTNIRYVILVMVVVSVIIALLVRFLSGRLRDGLDEFSAFFRRAASSMINIDPKTFHFSEFIQLAKWANQMVDNRRQAEKALRESEEKYRSLFQLSNEGILLIRDVIFDCNEAACKILQYKKGDLLGKTLASISPPVTDEGIEAVEAQNRIFQAAYDGRPQVFEWKCYRKSGTIAELQFALNAVTFADDQFLLASGRDVTGINQAQRTIVESEMRWKAFIESSPDAFHVFNTDGIIVEVNEATCRSTGYTRDELIGMSILNLESKYTFEESVKLWNKIELGEVKSFEGQNRRKDGTVFPVEVRLAAVDINGEKILIGFVSDITERKAMEREKENYQHRLIQAQKMEAIGSLAGGIAHDFNNLLMGIQGRASLMAYEEEASETNAEHINAIIEYVKSATDLSGRLLGIAREGKYEARPIDINEVVRQSAAMFGRTNKQIRIHNRLCHPVPVATADRQQLEQVLLNLFINAGQAMPEGGEIYLETSIDRLDEGFCEPHSVPPGRYVRISVADTGVGIAESIRHRIFDPFFTTKEKGRGTGLGLASAYGIIKNHSGIITVSSEVDRGTQFEIYLPITDQKPQPVVVEDEAPVKGVETILLVDDEKLILDVGGAMLQKLGYHVIFAPGGRQALEIVKEKSKDIHLVILDMIMPDMEGGATFDRIRSIDPNLPVLLSSGYSLNNQTAAILDRGCNGFIQKPFNMSELSRKVRSILDEAPGKSSSELRDFS